MNNTVCASQKYIEIIEKQHYSREINEQFTSMPEVAKPLLKSAKKTMKMIEKMLYTAPAFINMIEASIPKQVLQAVLSNDQRAQLADGALKLMTKKDGTLLANLVNPKTNRIVSSISLEHVSLSPDLTEAITNYATQMQLAQIAEEIHIVQLAIEEVRQGQESDRLAIAYSCQQKLLQAMLINKPELRSMALLRITSDAEDSRNLLMQSQIINLAFIKEQPESLWGKLITGAKPEKISQRMNEIRESLSAINMVSLAEAIAYQELGEGEAARQSLQYYASYLQNAYLSTDGFVQRLDMIDPSPENYWSKTLPEISKKIQALPSMENILLSEGDYDEE